MENKLAAMKAWCETSEVDLGWFAHNSWASLHIAEAGITAEMVDDLYCGLVGGVYYNHGRIKQ